MSASEQLILVRSAPGGLFSYLIVVTVMATLGASTSVALAQGVAASPVEAPTPSLTDAAIAAYLAGRNIEAARLGLAAIEKDPDHADLRLKTANALGWTGQFPDALRLYDSLLQTPLKDDATLGIANINLWNGRPDTAVQLFTQLLASNPTNASASDGIKEARLQARPRTEVRAFGVRDSDGSERRIQSISHQWRSDDYKQIYEVNLEGGSESLDKVVSDLKLRDLAIAIQDVSLPLSPKLKVEVQDSPIQRVFFELNVKPTEIINVEVGRVNWAKVVFAPQARRDGLYADKVSLSGKLDGALGHVSGQFTRFQVSDGNVVQTAAAEYWPSWQPLPESSGVRLFTGMFSYMAERNVAAYWSPASGHTIAFIGGAFGKWEKEYEIFAELKRSVRISGEGSGNTYVRMGGKVFLNKDWAICGEANLLESEPAAKVYHSPSLMVALQRYW